MPYNNPFRKQKQYLSSSERTKKLSTKTMTSVKNTKLVKARNFTNSKTFFDKNILMFQNNPVTQKDVTGWVQTLIAEINKSAVKKSGGSGIPQVALTPDILWFGTLLYCGLDPAQPLVKASLKLIDAEWDKLKRNARRDS